MGGETAPGPDGRFGAFGGRYVPETLVAALEELETAWRDARADPGFGTELDACLRDFVGRPTAFTCAPRLSAKAGGAMIWLKREDLAHTGAHKINNTVGQVLLAKRMGKTRIIAETGAGQHGVATATGRSGERSSATQLPTASCAASGPESITVVVVALALLASALAPAPLAPR